MSRETKCGWCFEGEVGFPPDAHECPYCDGSGFVNEPDPPGYFDTIKKEAIDRMDIED